MLPERSSASRVATMTPQGERAVGQGRLGYRFDGVLLRATATNPTTIQIDLESTPDTSEG
jgi:hypothetical protein